MFDNAIMNLLPKYIKESLINKKLNSDSLHLLEQISIKMSHEYIFKNSDLRLEAVNKSINDCINKFNYVDNTNVDNSYEFFYNIIRDSLQSYWSNTLHSSISFPSREELNNRIN